jgi:ESCRT-II complex subunit VPS36
MAKAQEMVKLAEYFKERSAAKRQGAASDGEEELDAQTALDLLDLGIVSPVTRETAGSLYHRELARQVCR